MNAERLLQHYEQIADAPDAIARLRRFILDLAVRGKLVPQDPADEPASELLKRIAAERDELVRGKVIRKDAPLAVSTVRHFPHVIPSSWTWTRVGDTALFTQYGTSQKSHVSQSGVPVLTMGNIQDGCVIWGNEKRIPEASDDLPALYLRTFDLLYNRTNSAELVGKTGIYMGENDARTFASYLIRLRPSLLHSSPIYLNFAMNAPCFRETQIVPLIKKQTGQANVSGSALKSMLIPLPPLAEQHRIVAKVDELMALCDELEATRKERETKRDRLVTASLARLNTPNPETFRDDARFSLDALPALTARPDQIKQLRQTILNLAVRGKLVPQDMADEPADILFSKARLAKEALRKERRINRDEDPEFSTSSNESQSPAHWSWAYLADFALVQGGKRLPAGADFSAEPTENVYIRVTDMKNSTISSASLKYVSKDVHEAISKYVINKEDIYITIAGTIGCVGEVPDFLDGHNLTENAAKIVFREIDRRFLIMVLSSDDVQSQFAEKTKQMAQPKLALKRVLGARIPIPPLAEQQRMVAKVDELMALCDQLEASLTSADETRKKLLDTLLAEALPSVDAEALPEAAE
ncbi:restriction endonuclease subunit S [Rhizobium anhuiense]|uniref:restriction endonuclease subunit S n=1 Tax=Rhizobium anhuiense TaxID=1184720 RepID=UPI00041C9E4B|nr:restriction endonuclease subunit S [Rhizobium anhuiense]PDS63518.1 restriction endonuclease subunit S [Rhizobium anhuiense]